MAKTKSNKQLKRPRRKHSWLKLKENMSSTVSLKKGIFTEYLDRNLDLNQLVIERQTQLKRISSLRDGRTILVYVANFNKGNVAPISIDYQDITPINDQLSILNGDRLDFILETPGGMGEIAEDIVKLLRSRFKEVNIIIPKRAMSAGTLIAMACDEILMEPISALGPIDAQLFSNGKQFSADAFIAGLDEIKKEVEITGRLNSAYIPILQAISPGEIQNAKNALSFAKKLVTKWLTNYKFKDWTHKRRTNEEISPEYKKQRASDIADKLAAHGEWLTHGRSLKIEDLREMELDITDYSENADLADAIRRYQILVEITFAISPIYKLYETPFSQIAIHLQQQPPEFQMPLQALIPNLDCINMDIVCQNCKTVNKLQANFDSQKPIKAGFVSFPESDVIKCFNCQSDIDLRPARQQIERQFNKKII